MKNGIILEGSAPTPVERRRSSRIRLQVAVFLRAADSSGVDFIELAKTLNISVTGACVASVHQLRPQQMVQLTFPAPSSPSSTWPPETPPISARVQRQEMSGELRLCRLEFVHPLE